MKYQIKRHILEEGVLQHVKDNIAGYGAAAGGLAAASAGVFGDEASAVVNNGASKIGDAISKTTSHFTDKMHGNDTSGGTNNVDDDSSTSNQHKPGEIYKNSDNNLVSKNDRGYVTEYNNSTPTKSGIVTSDDGNNRIDDSGRYVKEITTMGETGTDIKWGQIGQDAGIGAIGLAGLKAITSRTSRDAIGGAMVGAGGALRRSAKSAK